MKVTSIGVYIYPFKNSGISLIFYYTLGIPL